jgi:uncharacterized protein YbjT (DUF2867 family)
MQAIVLGGSGQVGSRLVTSLLRLSPEECSKITLISRRPLDEFQNDDRVSVQIVDYANLSKGDESSSSSMDLMFQDHNSAFMLMGIGEPRKATSQEELERVDADIPIAFSAACARNGVKHMSVLSAIGADSKQTYSRWTTTAAGGGWYSYCKGKMEEGIQALPFESVLFFQPAGIYPGNENTPSLVGKLNALLNPILPGRFETASSEQIADSMVKLMKEQLLDSSSNSKWTGSNNTITGGQAIKNSLLD